MTTPLPDRQPCPDFEILHVQRLDGLMPFRGQLIPADEVWELVTARVNNGPFANRKCASVIRWNEVMHRDLETYSRRDMDAFRRYQFAAGLAELIRQEAAKTLAPKDDAPMLSQGDKPDDLAGQRAPMLGGDRRQAPAKFDSGDLTFGVDWADGPDHSIIGAFYDERQMLYLAGLSGAIATGGFVPTGLDRSVIRINPPATTINISPELAADLAAGAAIQRAYSEALARSLSEQLDRAIFYGVDPRAGTVSFGYDPLAPPYRPNLFNRLWAAVRRVWNEFYWTISDHISNDEDDDWDD